MTMTEILLALDNVTTVYGNIEMLRQVSMQVERGKIVCLLGSNGAGKSTLIKAILGLAQVVGGSITFDGQDITGEKTHKIIRQGISIVPEGKRIFPKMTTMENLRMGAYIEQDDDLIEERMERVFKLFPRLEERATQIAGTMSGGEQSMLSIGRGLMSSPELMIFDEPSLGLAPVLVEQNFETIQQKGQVVVEGTSDQLMESEVIQSAYLKS
jgi:branched-chain amino acid transport system ATP-binding protein